MLKSLDDAIKHCEELAEKNEAECQNWAYGASQINNDESRKKQYQKHAEWWHERAKERRQLAEWLRELKKLRELPDKLVPKYRDGVPDEYNRGANEMLEEVIDDIRKYMEEVNADGDSN